MVSLQGTPSNFTPGPLGNLWMGGTEGTRLFESTPGSMKKPESPLNLLADIASSPADKDKNDDFTMDMDDNNKLGNSNMKQKIRNGRMTKKNVGKNSGIEVEVLQRVQMKPAVAGQGDSYEQLATNKRPRILFLEIS